MNPFIAQIMMVPQSFAPKNWSLCAGQLLPINQNQALFSLLGTAFGGNGQTTFGLPDLRGRIPFGVGRETIMGQKGGEENHTLTQQELPAHTHSWSGSATSPTQITPAGNVLGGGGLYRSSPGDSPMLPSAVSSVGGNQPHPNLMPFQVLNYCIALTGIFPSRN